MEGQNGVYRWPVREREEPEVLPALLTLSCCPTPSSRVLGQWKGRCPGGCTRSGLHLLHPQRVAPPAPSALAGRPQEPEASQSREGMRVADRRPLPGKQGEHQDSGGAGGAAAGFPCGGAEAPARRPAGLRAAALHVPAAGE